MLPQQHTDEIINSISQKTDAVILFYSAGKDSIALLDICAKKFKKVICLLMYFIPGLEHIERYVRFSEKKYNNIEFIQTPHWCLTYIHKIGFFCVANPKIKLLKLADVMESARLKTGIQTIVLGSKQADNMNRRIMLRTYEKQAISHTGVVYPLSKWKDKDVLKYIQANKLPMPIRYGNKRSNGVGFDIEVFVYLQKHYPKDLEAIFKAYPLSEKILFEHEQRTLQTV